jgi:hypothetical protein
MAYKTKTYEIQAYKLVYLEQARLPLARREVDSALRFKTARNSSNFQAQEMKQIRPATSVISGSLELCFRGKRLKPNPKISPRKSKPTDAEKATESKQTSPSKALPYRLSGRIGDDL